MLNSVELVEIGNDRFAIIKKLSIIENLDLETVKLKYGANRIIKDQNGNQFAAYLIEDANIIENKDKLIEN